MTALAWILAFHADSQPLVQRLPAQNHPVRCQEFDRIRKLTFCAKAPPGLAFMADRVPRGRFCPLPIVLPPAKNRATGDPERSFLAPETPRALPGANLALRPARLALPRLPGAKRKSLRWLASISKRPKLVHPANSHYLGSSIQRL